MQHKNDSVEINSHYLWQERKKKIHQVNNFNTFKLQKFPYNISATKEEKI